MKISDDATNLDDVSIAEQANRQLTSLDKISELRRSNLRNLASRYGTSRQFLRELQSRGTTWTPGYLSAMIGTNPSRSVSERTARTIESALGLFAGALDLAGHTEFENIVDRSTVPKGIIFGSHLPSIEKNDDLPRVGVDRTEDMFNPVFSSSIGDTSTNARSTGEKQRINKADIMTDVLQAVIQSVGARSGQEAFNPKRHGKIVYLAYENALLKGAVNPDFIEQLLSIMVF